MGGVENVRLSMRGVKGAVSLHVPLWSNSEEGDSMYAKREHNIKHCATVQRE